MVHARWLCWLQTVLEVFPSPFWSAIVIAAIVIFLAGFGVPDPRPPHGATGAKLPGCTPRHHRTLDLVCRTIAMLISGTSAERPATAQGKLSASGQSLSPSGSMIIFFTTVVAVAFSIRSCSEPTRHCHAAAADNPVCQPSRWYPGASGPCNAGALAAIAGIAGVMVACDSVPLASFGPRRNPRDSPQLSWWLRSTLWSARRWPHTRHGKTLGAASSIGLKDGFAMAVLVLFLFRETARSI